MDYANQDYFANEILTAPPAKLHAMLLEGAVRFTRQALHFYEQQPDLDRATDAVVKALKIMSELMAALNPAHDEALVKQVAGEYVFIVRALSEGNLRQDPEELRSALRVLDMQRETWKLLVEQQDVTPSCAVIAPPHRPRTSDSAKMATTNRNSSFAAPADDSEAEGPFSLDA